MAYVTTSDFTGKYELTLTDFNTTKLSEYIDRYEDQILIELFGKELFDLWETGISGSDPIYEALRDPFTEQLTSGEIIHSRGTIDMITGFVYFYYLRDQFVQQTSNGAVKNSGENSDKADMFTSGLTLRYNEAVETYQAIQAYIIENYSDYPEFEGVTKRPMLRL